MHLARALRLDSPFAYAQVVSLVGAGGKTTALFQLARNLQSEIANRPPAILVAATSHLGAWQIPNADQHIIAQEIRDPAAFFDKLNGVVLVTGEIKEDRALPIDEIALNELREHAKTRGLPLLIEADGSREHPLKAPAEHEPPIPQFTDAVIVVAGLSALGKPLNKEHVHRAEIFSKLAQLPPGQIITPEALLRALTHPQGGLKNIPPTARRVALLNQCDTPELQSIGWNMARKLLDHFDSAVTGSLQQKVFQTVERTAGIILAAGESTRFGAPKQLLDWHGKPFVRHIAETALHAGLWPVIVVTGFCAADVESCLKDLPVHIVHNPAYAQGQGASIRKGIESLYSPPPPLAGASPKSDVEIVGFGGGRVGVGSAIFLLADQPQIPAEIIRALTERRALELPAILAPLVLEERRANPVLFDRVTFPHLMQLTGDVGGRAIFDKHRVEYLPWHDEQLLFDVDKPEDYQRLKELE